MLSLVTIYWFYSKLHTIKTEFQVLVRMLIKIQICRLPERIQSVFSHIVRKDSSNLPKPSPQCQMVRLHKYYVISLTIITLLSSLYSRVQTRVQYLHTYHTTFSLPPPMTTWPWCSPPPRPKSCQNLMRPWAASEKNISTDSWCQCALIRRHRRRRAATAVAASPPPLRCRANATTAALSR